MFDAVRHAQLSQKRLSRVGASHDHAGHSSSRVRLTPTFTTDQPVGYLPTMGLGRWDDLGELLYRRAGKDPRRPARMVVLAKRLLGDSAVQYVPDCALPGDAAFARVNGAPRIFVREGLPQSRLRFAVAHELAHWALGIGSETLVNESVCDALAAALVAPRDAFRFAVLNEGASFRALGEKFGASESCMALRIGEVFRAPLALVTPKVVRTRGDGFHWPDDSEIRAIAKVPKPGLRRVAIGDDVRRVVLRVA